MDATACRRRSVDARREDVDWLWFVGDFASFDVRVQEATRLVARVFQAAGIDFGILYEGERNAGNDVRRAGEEGLFELLVEHNVGQLSKARFRRIVTTDPHTLNTLRFEYPRLRRRLRGLALQPAPQPRSSARGISRPAGRSAAG